jgi:hypothetical protein
VQHEQQLVLHTYDEVYVWVPVADLWYHQGQNVDAFAVDKPAQRDDVDGAARGVARLVGVRLKFTGVNSCRQQQQHRTMLLPVSSATNCTGQMQAGRYAAVTAESFMQAQQQSQHVSPFGMTDTAAGCRLARSTVFSLLVWLTQMTCCTSASTALMSLLVAMLAASAKPNREWSVNTTCKHNAARHGAALLNGTW